VNGVKLADILFYLCFRPSVHAHWYLYANISKMVWDRRLVPVTH